MGLNSRCNKYAHNILRCGGSGFHDVVSIAVINFSMGIMFPKKRFTRRARQVVEITGRLMTPRMAMPPQLAASTQTMSMGSDAMDLPP